VLVRNRVWQPAACAKTADVGGQLAPLTLRPPHIAQCSLAVAVVRLAAVRDAARDIANCSIAIVMGCPQSARLSPAINRET
jgi:hypothetical protein